MGRKGRTGVCKTRYKLDSMTLPPISCLQVFERLVKASVRSWLGTHSSTIRLLLLPMGLLKSHMICVPFEPCLLMWLPTKSRSSVKLPMLCLHGSLTV